MDAKYLGVTLSNALEWSKHIATMTNKANSKLSLSVCIRSSKTSNKADRHERPLLKPCCVLFRWPCLFMRATTCFLIIRSKTLIMVDVSDIGI